MVVFAIGLAIAGLCVLSDVVMLAVGGVIVAAALRAMSDPLARRWRVAPKLAFALTLAAALILVVTTGVLIGARLAEQAGQLLKTLPQEIAQIHSWADRTELGHTVSGLLTGTGKQSLAGVAGRTFGILIDILVILFLGLYLGIDPDLYRRGALHLIPPEVRPRAAAALDAAGAALRRWLLGQLVSMAIIGVVTGVGLWLMGSPLALSLGVLAGLMEFIPFIGPILASIPAILVAFAQGPSAALWVAVFYLALHQLEGNILMPLVQRWAVSLPPALGVAAVIVFSLLFGFLGILFATPLMVVVMVFVRKLYVEPVIEEPAERSGV